MDTNRTNSMLRNRLTLCKMTRVLVAISRFRDPEQAQVGRRQPTDDYNY